jgi:hypothetical protein
MTVKNYLNNQSWKQALTGKQIIERDMLQLVEKIKSSTGKK